MKTTFKSETIGTARSVTIQRGNILDSGLRLSVWDSVIGRRYIASVIVGANRVSVYVSRDDAKRLVAAK